LTLKFNDQLFTLSCHQYRNRPTLKIAFAFCTNKLTDFEKFLVFSFQSLTGDTPFLSTSHVPETSHFLQTNRRPLYTKFEVRVAVRSSLSALVHLSGTGLQCVDFVTSKG